MSTIQSLDNNYYIKEYDNIEKYLLRIIKRYFDLEELNNMNAINAVIAEAMNRYKAGLTYKTKDVLTLNDKYGIVNIDLNDLDGELKFAKANAFNKDFGDQEDTICEGNDPRLYDDREPIEHHHKIEDVINLVDILDSLNRNLSRYKYHYHLNTKVLNKLVYSNAGPLDLKKLEILWFIVEGIIANIRTDLVTLANIFAKNKAFIEDKLSQIYDLSETLYLYYHDNKDIIETQIENLINNMGTEMSNSYTTRINNLVDNPEGLLNSIKSSLCLIGSKEVSFGIVTGYITNETDSDDSETMRYMYEHSNVFEFRGGTLVENTPESKADKWIFDEENKCFTSVTNSSYYEFFLSDQQYEKYDFTVKLTSTCSWDDDLISIIIATVGDTSAPNGNKEYIDQPGTPPFNVICLNVDRGGVLGSNNIEISYGTPTNNRTILAKDLTQERVTADWNGSYIYIRVIRDKQHFTIYRSDFDSPNIKDEPIFDFNLTDFDIIRDDFDDAYYYRSELNKSQYGLGAYSQEDSSFRNFKFTGMEETILEDVEATFDPDIVRNSIINNELITIPSTDLSLIGMEINTYLLYNDDNGNYIKQELPYINENFIISTDICNEEIKVNLKKTNSDAFEIPMNIIKSKLLFEFYKNITG